MRYVYGIDTNDKFWCGTLNSNGDDRRCKLTPETISNSGNTLSLSWIDVNYCFVSMDIEEHSQGYTRDIPIYSKTNTRN